MFPWENTMNIVNDLSRQYDVSAIFIDDDNDSDNGKEMPLLLHIIIILIIKPIISSFIIIWKINLQNMYKYIYI